ncbi:hypothetical protein NM962_04550 [Mycobacterium sp. SVM_VP21]|nr:hypothetical protein NM962_04550 [Mycobacterium sp. SVM_VP21]
MPDDLGDGGLFEVVCRRRFLAAMSLPILPARTPGIRVAQQLDHYEGLTSVLRSLDGPAGTSTSPIAQSEVVGGAGKTTSRVWSAAMPSLDSDGRRVAHTVSALAAWGVLLMAGSIFIGLRHCVVSVGYSSGILHYQTLAVDTFRERFVEITGATVDEYVKAIPRFRKLLSRIPLADGPFRTIGDGARTLSGRPVSLTNERRWKIVEALQDGPAYRMTEDTEKRLLTVALFCANLPIKEPPPDAVKAKVFSGQRQAELLLARTKVDISNAQSVEDLFVAYQCYRAVVRRKWFHALTGGHRKILKAKAAPQVVFWKKILAYSGTGSGVGTLLYLISTALRNENLRHVPWPLIGGGVGVFLFATGVVKSAGRGHLTGQDRTQFRLFVQRQPLLATGLLSGQVVMGLFVGIMALFLVLLVMNFAQGLALGLALGFLGT